MLATADKIYRAWAQNAGGAADVETLLPAPPNARVGERLPQPVELGRPVRCRVRVSDDLQRWHAEGRLDSVVLTLRLSNLEYADGLNQLAVALNGRELPQGERCRPADLHFHVLPEGPVGPYGYILAFELTAAFEFPRLGENEVELALTKRDEKIEIPMEVTEASHTESCYTARVGQLHRDSG